MKKYNIKIYSLADIDKEMLKILDKKLDLIYKRLDSLRELITKL
jgi:hypothetical protein